MKQQQKTQKQILDDMREQVQEHELRARYWKAQYEVKQYTLLNEEIQPKYDAWHAEQAAKQEEMQKNLEGALKDLANKGAEVVVDGQSVTPVEDTEFKERVLETIKSE